MALGRRKPLGQPKPYGNPVPRADEALWPFVPWDWASLMTSRAPGSKQAFVAKLHEKWACVCRRLCAGAQRGSVRAPARVRSRMRDRFLWSLGHAGVLLEPSNGERIRTAPLLVHFGRKNLRLSSERRVRATCCARSVSRGSSACEAHSAANASRGASHRSGAEREGVAPMDCYRSHACALPPGGGIVSPA